MSSTEPKIYNCNNLIEIKQLGSGSFGCVKLLYDKVLRRTVVGKFFQSSGERSKIRNQFDNASREAEFQAQLKHQNIVRVLGVSLWDERNFVIILEYASSGNLETLLHTKRDVVLPWKLRSRFFAELANALDYLHNHDPNTSYIHGDLKPQNVLLGDNLAIKLADFGAAAIAEMTGATTLTIINKSNTAHTPCYAAPEYLKDPNKGKPISMDVYGYGLIGYEILTRKTVFSGINLDVVISLIISRGQKPNEKYLDDVETTLPENSIDIFHKLREIIEQCWQFESKDRPKISDVKKDLDQLAQYKQIYDKETDKVASNVVNSIKLQSSIIEKSPSNIVAYQCILWLVIIAMFSVIVVVSIEVFLNFEVPDAHGTFLAINSESLYKYNVRTKKITFLSNYRKPDETPIGIDHYPKAVVGINGLVYVITSMYNAVPVLRANLSDQPMKWKTIKWTENDYIGSEYIAFERKIYVLGGKEKTLEGGSNSFYAECYSTATGKWTRLQRMNQVRTTPTLVVFQGMICAIGGVRKRTSECFNRNTNKWFYLPPMKISRANAAAVELNGELYVIGGSDKYGNIRNLRSVEKYNPVTRKWIEVAPLSQSRTYHVAGVVDGKIYVIRGSALVEAYDPLKNTWEVVDNNFRLGVFSKITPALQ